MISLQNLDREHAFSDGDVRLLTTLAASLSVALENARLIARDPPAGRPSSTSSTASARRSPPQLDLDALIELVGEQMRETFEADIVYVALLDAAPTRSTFPYYSEDGPYEAQAAAAVRARA